MPFGVRLQADGVGLANLVLRDNGIRVGAGSAVIDKVDATELVVLDGADATLTDVAIEWEATMRPGSTTSISGSRLCVLGLEGDATLRENVIGDGCVDFPDKPLYEVTLLRRRAHLGGRVPFAHRQRHLRIHRCP